MDYKCVGPTLDIDPQEFLEEIIKSKDQDKLTPRTIVFFIQIANHAINKLHHENPLDRDDCIQAALYDLTKYWRGFDKDLYTNAFAYFTQMAKNAYAKEYKKIHRNKFLKKYQIFKIRRPIKSVIDFIRIDKLIENKFDDIDNAKYIKSFRYSEQPKKFSQWYVYEIKKPKNNSEEEEDIDTYDEIDILKNKIDIKEMFDKNGGLYYVEIKYEFKDQIQVISLDNFGGNEIYTV